MRYKNNVGPQVRRRRYALGWYPRLPERADADALVRSIRLLSGPEMAGLFPGATLHRERFLGLTKSFIAAGGFENGP